MATLKDITDFLGASRIAMVGASRDPRAFSRVLLRALLQRGYTLVPVNACSAEITGTHCFARVRDISPPVDRAFLLTPAAATLSLAQECAESGIRFLWMYAGMGRTAVDPATVAFCQVNGIRLIAGECPFMFLPEAGWLHRFHGCCRKLRNRYPTAA